MKKRLKQLGFSLVELSVVLSVIGITLGGALTLATKKTEAEKLEETEDKMDEIATALDLFLINNQRIPCPASGSVAITAANYGVEGQGSAPTVAGCQNLGADHGLSSGDIYIGVVPTKTLNLADDVMIDGWGRRISYAVDYKMALNITINTNCADSTPHADYQKCFRQNPTGGIRINDASGTAKTLEAVYALISNGDNGFGAWKKNGSTTRLTASSDADELENTDADIIFVQRSETATFDDVVRYRAKTQIIDEVGGVTDDDVCAAADSAAATCTGASNPDDTNCLLLAATIVSFCFQP